MKQEKELMDSVLRRSPFILGEVSRLIFSPPANFTKSRYPIDYNYPVKYEGPSQRSIDEIPSVVSRYEAIGLFQEAVETARLGMQLSLAGSEKVGEVIKPKLTVDLSHKSIEEVPDDIVDLLKKDVERYSLTSS